GRFQVVFSHKEYFWADYTSSSQVEENLELAYAISVHKSQGSEFERVYFILPKDKVTLLSRELFYTGMTRARRHCTIFVQEDISFYSEVPTNAPDGTLYYPDFTITWARKACFWKNLGHLENDEYLNPWKTKQAWYENFFPGRLVTTKE